MKYFAIHFTLNEKIAGKIEQIKDYIYHCDMDNDPLSIDKFPFQKIDFDPTLAIPILSSKAERTDFINVNGSMGFSFGSIVISDKLKNIIEKFIVYGIDFYKTSVIHNTIEYHNYWQSHIFDLPFKFIDFEKTTFKLKDRDVNRKVINKIVKFNEEKEFLKFADEISYPKMIFFNDIVFKEEMNLDYFALRYTEASHIGIVSERLKNEIEKNDIKELEYRPLEITFEEWLHNGEREKVYGKY